MFGALRPVADLPADTPLYQRLSIGIAADPPLADLLLHAPPQRQPVLLFACVHNLLLVDGDELGGVLPQPHQPGRGR